MRAHFQGQRRRNRPRSRAFPKKRLIIALLVTILLASGCVLFILSTLNIIPGYWSAIFTPIFIVAGLLIALFTWLFPLTPGDATSQPSQPQQPLSTHPTTQKPTTPWNVPHPHSPFFIGREGLLTQLYNTLHNDKAAALTQAISGLGGIGKTQLAVEYAYLYRDTYDAILWTTAITSEILFADFVALAEALDLPEKDSQDQTITVNAVIRWLETSSHWLLIFDNADDLELIRDFLPTSGKGHVIITTRTQATGTVAQPIEVTKLEPDDGAVLLLHRARSIPLDASLADASGENQADAKAIVQLLDGLPLAIDQAVA